MRKFKKVFYFSTVFVLMQLFFAKPLNAQQLPNYSNYLYNYYSINPAAIGSSGCINFKVGYRSQWVGFEGAPKTQWATVNFFLKRKKKLWKKNKHSLGFNIESDQTGYRGPIRQNRFQVGYAYHIYMKNNTYFAAGIFGGLVQYTFMPTLLTLPNPDDPLVGSGGQAFLYPDFNPGILLYSDKYFIGASVKHAYGNRLGGIYGANGRLNRHVFITGGYTIGGERALIRYTPMFNIRYAAFGSPSFDISFMVTYDKNIDIGLSYRWIEGPLAFIAYRVGKWGIGYAYDYAISKIRFGASNSHEIILSYKICPKSSNGYEEKEFCPAYR